MKKLLLILFAIIIFAGCSFNGSTAPQETAKPMPTANTSEQIVPSQSIMPTNPTITDTILYENKQYGFNLTLPASWNGYHIFEDKWEGQPIGQSGITESGPLITVRHPGWSEENPRQDIPFIIFTIPQWESLLNEEFHIGAAPIGPTELARNSEYVFTIPARYNFSFPEGYEEVEEIIKSNSFQAN